MHSLFRRLLVAAALVLAALPALAAGPSDQALRPWTVRDSVSLRLFSPMPGDSEPLTFRSYGAEADKPAVLSPDGKHFFFVSFRGDPDKDENVGELQVFSTETVLRALRSGQKQPLQPISTASIHSHAGGDWEAPIIQPEWLDGHRIGFLGMPGHSTSQVHVMDIRDGSVTQLTDVDGVVDPAMFGPRNWEMADDGTLVFKVRTIRIRTTDTETPLDQYPVRVVEDRDLADLFNPWEFESAIYVARQGSDANKVMDVPKNGTLYGPWISPDGRWAVMVYPIGADKVPAEWKSYELGSANGYRYMLMDMATGETRPMLNAPIGTSMQSGRDLKQLTQAYWMADSSQVVLFNTALPLDKDAETRRATAYIVSYALNDGSWEVVTPIKDASGARVVKVDWAKQGEALRLHRDGADGKPVDGKLATLRNGKWQFSPVAVDEMAKPAGPVWPEGLKVVIDQGPNKPPTMIASLGDRTVALSQPDPALSGVRRLDWERVDFPLDGKTVKAMVLRPHNQRGPAPLVILAGDPTLYEAEFRPDGALYSGFAGQSLAASGFVVMYLESVFADPSIMVTPREGPESVKRVDAAIDQLVDKGWVDATRIGMAGFSRSGFVTYYTITHPGKYRIGAAYVFDSVTGSYGDYIIGMATGTGVHVYAAQWADSSTDGSTLSREQVTAAPSFWDNKEGWLKGAPEFNLDKVSTPTIFSAVGRHNAWVMMGTLGAWRYNDTPFEYHFYPQGMHQLLRPAERVVAMQANVEWMSFWLQDTLPQDKARADKWTAMKTKWEQTQTDRAGAAGRHEK